MPESPTARLRDLLSQPGILVIPGCYDALSARLLEQAGFPAGYVTGFGTAASSLGVPDTGLVTFREMLSHATNMAAAVSIPLVADADTGYGNEVNVYRTVRANARAGLAGVQIEDQVWPKRCGHVEGKAVVDLDEARRRIRAAADARAEGDIVVVARTDACQALGFDAALERSVAFAEEGADVVFPEAIETPEQVRAVVEAVDAPVLVNLIEGGRTPMWSPAELEAWGARVVIYPLTLLSVAAAAIQDHMGKGESGVFDPHDGALSFEALKTLVGFDEYEQHLQRYR